MAPVALRSNSNYYSQGWNPVQSGPSIEMAIEPRPGLGPGTSGLFNLYYVPRDFILSIQDQIHAINLNDREGSRENWLKILEAPFNIIVSIFNAINFVSKTLIYFQAIKPNCLSFLPSISRKMPFIGLVVCTIESLIEMQGLSQAHSLLKRIRLPDRLGNGLATDNQMFRSLIWLDQEFCKRNTITDAIRTRSLSRRLYPHCAKKIQELVPLLIREFGRVNFEERSLWRKRTCELLKDVKTQSQKKMLMHISGLAAAIITIAGLIATLCLCPWGTVLVLMIIAGVFSTMRYGISEGMMHTNGWTFDKGNLIPQSIKNFSYKIFTRCVARESSDRAVLSQSH